MFFFNKYRRFIAYLCLKDMKYLYELFEGRQQEIEELWSQKSSVKKVLERVRKPRYYELPVRYLMSLPFPVLKDMDTFFDNVDKFTFYLEFTVDMPTTFSENYTSNLAKLRNQYNKAATQLQKYC